MATNVKRKKKKAEVMAEDGSMTLTGHLKELRNRLIICAVVFVVGVVVSPSTSPLSARMTSVSSGLASA